ncbi:hypothetical protein ATG98_3347 [Marinobacter sp. LV10R520-4]|uniref:hypothetical protein n=1 Tax=Marinobacter sp. LV10R520-4 TaxID=1761796 RepID=UPI000C011FF4|nr:hypothetical protein [Marinobacter sp. LV10R520-4]PFG54143.1 hypothetical protein ATG98_3347 [Marinobacter sp. LV10R520-4]
MSRFTTLVLAMMLPLSSSASSLIHPLDFKGTEDEKANVIAQITVSVKQTYSQIGMGDPSTLRMMEKEELNSFKKLRKVKNRKLLDGVIDQYCNIGMCNYNTILMMYNEQSKASKEELNW